MKYIVNWKNLCGKHGEQWWLFMKQQNIEKMEYVSVGELLSYAGIDFNKPIDVEW
jgi:hypothetical protein